MPYKNGDSGSKGRYLHTLVKFMNWKYDFDEHGREYHPYDNPNVSKTRLRATTDEDVARWFTVLAFHKENYDKEIDKSTFARASCLMQYKKAISHFVVNKNWMWDEEKKRGNPTRSVRVNKVIKDVQQLEANKRGAPPKKRREMKPPEYEKGIGMIEDRSENITQDDSYYASAYFKYQLAMVARLDDVAKLRLDTFGTYSECPTYAINTSLCWSKNVLTEEDAPAQILLGAMDERYCPLIGLALWLEYSLSMRDIKTYVFELDGIEGKTVTQVVNRSKNKATNTLTKVIKSSEFTDHVINYNCMNDNKLGSHSIRKYATSKARGGGCHKDEVDYRARWKGKKRQQDDYTSVRLTWPDAKVAKALCTGGCIGYKIQASSGITDDWILKYVVPKLNAKLNRGRRAVSLVLGKALLWKIFADEKNYLPPEISKRVKAAYADIGEGRCSLEEGQNPVKKVYLNVYNDEQNVIIEEMYQDGEDERTGTHTLQNLDGGLRSELRFLNTQILGLRRENDDRRRENLRIDDRHMQMLRIMNRNIVSIADDIRALKRQRVEDTSTAEVIGDAVVRNTVREDAVMEGIDVNAKLSRGPISAEQLWNEYQFGIGSHKPAKKFTRRERGKVKSTYSRRKIVWKCIEEMVRGGHTASSVCQTIHRVYGPRGNMTAVIEAMHKDMKQRGQLHPDLRISNL